MIPVLLRLTFESGLSQAILYAVALGVIVYAFWSGYSGAPSKYDLRAKKELPAAPADRAVRGLGYGAFGAVIAWVGLHYALPATAFLGGKGEGIPIHTYGVMLIGGFMLAASLVANMAAREWTGAEGPKKREELLDLSFWLLLGGIAGSRVLFMLVNWHDYSGHWAEYLSSPDKLLEMLGSGLVFYGGLIGATFAAFIFSRRRNINFLRLCDLCIPTVSLGQCFGRLGCFSAGCCWGDVAKPGFPLSVHFPGAQAAKDIFGRLVNTASLAYQSQAADTRWVVPATGQIFHEAVPGAVRVSAWVAEHGHTLALHPTQLYESLGQLLLFLALMFLRRYRRFHGQIFGMWLMAYAVLRTSVELFRGDLERGTFRGLLDSFGMDSLAARVPLEAWYNISTSEFISLCMFAGGASLLYVRGRRVWGAGRKVALGSSSGGI